MNDSVFDPFPMGIPRIEDAFRVLDSNIFAQLQNYSAAYLQKNESLLTGYHWIKDALNQWSRVIEYPFCFAQLNITLQRQAQVLDAGSGVTFFPFWLSSQFNVICLDQDDYAAVYQNINQNQGTQVKFLQASLQKIPLENEILDAIYCLSVLEHTHDYGLIIEEFKRVLKPGGLLIITFDVALDGNEEGIMPQNAVELIEKIGRKFDCSYLPEDFQREIQEDGIYTTAFVNQFRNELLPWPQATLCNRLRNILRKMQKRRVISFRGQVQMTVCTLAVKKLR